MNVDLVGIAAVISALAAAWVSVRTLRVAKNTAEKIGQIDRAVNGQPPGTKTMVRQVQDLHDQIVPIPLKPEELQEAAMLPLLRRLVYLADKQAGNGPTETEKP